MNIICIYDCTGKNNIKLMKLLRRYLFHIQHSVFQGCLTPSKFKEMKNAIEKIIDPAHDQVILFFAQSDRMIHQVEIGKQSPDRFII